MTGKSGFATWKAYWDFAREVSDRRRYLLSQASQAFLDELMLTSRKRLTVLNEGHRFYRAQVAHAEFDDPEFGPITRPAPPTRMLPLPHSASDGRANPRGIPCLYMADDRHTAIAEVRPWIGSLVSVASMRTLKALTLVNVRAETDSETIYLFGEPSPEACEATIWSHVARAFREPVLREDNRAGYAPTQIIAEAFRERGYDGILYGSSFGIGTNNVVLFDVGGAELEYCEIHEIKTVNLVHSEIDNPYFVRKNKDGSSSLIQNVIAGIGPVGGHIIEFD